MLFYKDLCYNTLSHKIILHLGECMKILIDVLGCDNSENLIDGLALAINEVKDVTLVAVGDKAHIEERLQNAAFDRSRLEILHAGDVITNHDSPLAVRQKTDSSLVVAYNALKNEDIPVMITAGNTGAMIVGALMLLGRIDADARPTLATFLPTDNGKTVCLADCGANVDCKPADMVQFARHAVEYMQKVYGIPSPRVGLLSVGTEDTKGNAQTKETFALLKQSGLHFVGNMEGKALLSGDYDVVVADGFQGNVLLKGVEGAAKSVIFRALTLLKKHADKDVDLGFVKKAFADLTKSIDFNTQGGAVLLGVKKPVIKAHGSATAETVVSVVKQAVRMIENNYAK